MAKVSKKSTHYMQRQPKSEVAAVVAAESVSSGNLKEVIGGRLKEARERLGVTQKELCKRINMPLPSLRDYELGKRIPGGEALRLFAQAGIDLNWLITGHSFMVDERGKQFFPYPAPKYLPTSPPVLKNLAAPAGALDTARLQLAIETVEEGLQATGRTMTPAKKAELALAVYDLYADGTAKERILRLVKSAA